jgi:hypothetical protein
MKKFTFKKHIKEGRWRSFDRDCTDIKLAGKVIGHITELKTCDYSISFAIKKEKTKENPAPFRWIYLKQRFPNEAVARDMIKKYSNEIQVKHDLYSFDD